MATVRPIEPRDLDAIESNMDRRLKHSGAAWRRRLAWQYDANPWRNTGPGGVALVDGGRIVGYHFGITQPMWVAGATSLATFGLDLFIDPQFRGGLDSIALIRAIIPSEPECIVATTSANDVSMAIWTRLRAKAQPGGDVSLVKPLAYGRLLLTAAERALRRGVPPPCVALPWRPGREDCPDLESRSGWVGKPLGERLEMAAGLWQEVRRDFSFSTDRSETFLRWRYGASSPGGAVIGLFDAVGKLRAWYAFRLVDRGSAIPFRVFKLLDMVAAPNNREAIAACVADATVRARKLAHVIEVRGMGPEFRLGWLAAGFRQRRLVSNPFLVWARTKRLQVLPSSGTWHLVPADGDGGFG